MWRQLINPLYDQWLGQYGPPDVILVTLMVLLHVGLWRMSRPAKTPLAPRNGAMWHIIFLLVVIFFWHVSASEAPSLNRIYSKEPFFFIMAVLLFSVIAAMIVRDLGSDIQILAYCGVLNSLLVWRFMNAGAEHDPENIRPYLVLVAIGAVHVLIIKFAARYLRNGLLRLQRLTAMSSRLLGILMLMASVISYGLYALNGIDDAIAFLDEAFFLVRYPFDCFYYDIYNAPIEEIFIAASVYCFITGFLLLNPYVTFSIPARGLGWLPLIIIYGVAMALTMAPERSISGITMLGPLFLIAGLWLPSFRPWREYLNVPPLPRYPRRSRSGVTLIELLISIALISIGVWAFNSLASIGDKQADNDTTVIPSPFSREA